MLIAFGLGNFLAHSLLIRENFFLFAVCVALLYVKAQRAIATATPRRSNQLCDHINSIRFKRWTLSLGLVLAAFVIREMYASFGRFPYLYGARCHTPMILKTGDWSPGMFVLDVPVNARGVELEIRESQPVLNKKPLSLVVSASQPKELMGAQKIINYKLDAPNPHKIFVNLDAFGSQAPLQLMFTLSRCFTPKNLGVNADPRRLGIVVEKVLWR
jgi:hypothetical protein